MTAWHIGTDHAICSLMVHHVPAACRLQDDTRPLLQSPALPNVAVPALRCAQEQPGHCSALSSSSPRVSIFPLARPLCHSHLPSDVQENSHATAMITQLDLEKSQLQQAQAVSAAGPSHSSGPGAEAGQAGEAALEGLKLDLQQERAKRQQVSFLLDWLSCC